MKLRHRILVTAFLAGTTSLYEIAPANAEPVSLFLIGVQAGIAAGGVAAGAAGTFGALSVGFTVGGTLAGFAATTFGGVLLQAALSIGFAALASALRKSPATPPPQQRFVNLRQTVQNRTKGYGIYRDGGAVGLWVARGGARIYTVMVHTGEIEGIVGRWLDERFVSVDPSNYLVTEQGINGAVRVEEFNGGPNQTRPDILAQFLSEWPVNGRYENIAGAVIRAATVEPELFSSVYPTSREPVYTALIKGTKCYDPRNLVTQWTTNAALIIADWITSKDGLDRTVNWNSVSVEANECDVQIIDRFGTLVPKWQLCGPYGFNEPREQVRAALGVACDAFFYESTDGTVGFRVGRWIEPTVTLTAKSIHSMQISEGQSATDSANAMVVEYTEPKIGYREQESSPFSVDTDEEYEQDSVKAFFAPNHNQATRIAKRLLLRKRSKLKLSMKVGLSGYRLMGERFFRVDYEEAGMDNQAFEIDSLKLSEDRLSFEVEAMSVSQEEFDFDSATEEGEPSLNLEFDDGFSLVPPVNPVMIVTGLSGSLQLRVSWNAPTNKSTAYTMRWKQTGGLTWAEKSTGAGESTILSDTLADGATYEAQVRAKSSTGRFTDWVVVQPTSIVAEQDTVAPAQPTNVTLTKGDGSDLVIAWTNPASPNYFDSELRISTGTDYATATFVGLVGRDQTSFTVMDLPVFTDHYAWVTSRNGSGVSTASVQVGPTQTGQIDSGP